MRILIVYLWRVRASVALGPHSLRFGEFCLQKFGRSSCVRNLPFARPVPTQDNADTKDTHTYFHVPGAV